VSPCRTGCPGDAELRRGWIQTGVTCAETTAGFSSSAVGSS